jgi:hypothetical protein
MIYFSVAWLHLKTISLRKQGLASILSGGVLDGKSIEEKQEVLRRSEVFYFNRCAKLEHHRKQRLKPSDYRITGHSITVEDTRLYEESKVVPPSNTYPPSIPATLPTTPEAHGDDEQPTLTFAQLKELIESGKTDQIPNNKHIPDILNVRFTNP